MKEGVMEYWLEPKDFDELRKITCGNDPYWNDPYWAPTIGWKSEDGSNEACACGGGKGMKEVEQIKEDIFKIKRDVEEIKSMVQLKNKGKDDDQTESLCNKLQEIYESLVKKNSKQEEEIAVLVSALKEVKEEMRSLKQDMEKKTTNSPEINTDETTAMITPLINGNYGIKTSTNPHINEAAKNKKKGPLNQRSGFKIYSRPQGTILWPQLKSTSTVDHESSAETTTANEALTAPAEKASEYDVMFRASAKAKARFLPHFGFHFLVDLVDFVDHWIEVPFDDVSYHNEVLSDFVHGRQFESPSSLMFTMDSLSPGSPSLYSPSPR